METHERDDVARVFGDEPVERLLASELDFHRYPRGHVTQRPADADDVPAAILHRDGPELEPVGVAGDTLHPDDLLGERLRAVEQRPKYVRAIAPVFVHHEAGRRLPDALFGRSSGHGL